MSSLLRQLQVGSEASTVPELLAVERNRVQINTLMWVVGQEGSLKPGLTTRGTSSAPQKHSSKSARPMEAKPCCAFDDGHVHQLRRSGKNWLYSSVFGGRSGHISMPVRVQARGACNRRVGLSPMAW